MAGNVYAQLTSAPHQPAATKNLFRLPLIRLALLTLLSSLAAVVNGSPIGSGFRAAGDEDPAKPPDDPSFWLYIGIAIGLVLGGGAFAGLTIALMGQDEIYLQVIATSGEGAERKNAAKVLKLLQRGKHWVLVTLLLSNVITNETLPIVLDRSLGGGWPAVLSSTVLIVIFGEIVPQSVCVRYGLPIGAFMAPVVLALMWIMSPVAWPTAKLLDKLLGEDHGTMYKKAGLKTLVTLHRTLGERPDERLNQDEVTIISAVLDLKDKPVGSIMTPMSDVFTLSANAILDEGMMDLILSAGYSRIPIYAPENPRNFVGMLLVKMLITYDPEDCLRVRDFSLATLPETRPDTSCLDIVNFFQEGKSHMVLVSEFPGDPYGALGVLTLEDVIEELIGEEIIDESDVFVDVHKAIRRMTPAPKFRVPKGEVVTDPEPGTHTQEEGYMRETKSADGDRAHAPSGEDGHSHSQPTGTPPRSASGNRKGSAGEELGRSPRQATFLMRRRSSSGEPQAPVHVRSNAPQMRERLKSLGPRNKATDPKQTRINTVKIKPGTGVATIPENRQLQLPVQIEGSAAAPSSKQDPKGERQGLLSSISQLTIRPSSNSGAGAGAGAGNGGYGTLRPSQTELVSKTDPVALLSPRVDGPEITPAVAAQTHINDSSGFPKLVIDKIDRRSPTPSPPSTPSEETDDGDTVGSLQQRENTLSSVYGSAGKARHSRSPSQSSRRRSTARSGSITESTVDLGGGVKKLVLEMSSSNEDGETSAADGGNAIPQVDGAADEQAAGPEDGHAEGHAKRKRKKRAGKKKHGGAKHEEEPLVK